MSALRFWRGDGAHRATGDADTSAHRHNFKPRHCAGESCVHDHEGEPARSRDFAGLFEPFEETAS